MKGVNLINVMFIIGIGITVSETRQFRCDYSFSKRANGYFKYHRFPATWSDARLRCHMEGAVLASPYPDTVYYTLRELMTSPERRSTIFIGIHASFSHGDYYSINGTPVSQMALNWSIAEPDNRFNAEDCLTLTSQGYAADVNCSETHPYFCYKEKTDNDFFLDLCGTSDRAYEHFEGTGSCYKFHTVPRTWSRAYMACSAEGGHLAIVNGPAESEFIKKLYAKYPDTAMIGKFNKGIAFMGFHDWNEHGDWRTIHGETLTEAGFASFSPGQPDNAGKGEYCGSILRNGLYNDLSCSDLAPFICEKKPATLVCEEDECNFLNIQ